MRTPRHFLGQMLPMVHFARSHGIAPAAYRSLKGLLGALSLRRFIHFSVVDVFTASIAASSSLPHLPRVFTVRRAGPEDLPALQAFFAKPEKVRDRLRRGDSCLILLGEGTIYAAEWLAPGPTDYCEDWDDLHCIFRFPQGVGWLYDGLGHEASLGAWGMLMRCLPSYLHDSAIAEVYLAIDYDNVRSINSHKALGFQAISRICHLRVGGLSMSLYRPNAQNWQFLPGRVGPLELSGEAHVPD